MHTWGIIVRKTSIFWFVAFRSRGCLQMQFELIQSDSTMCSGSRLGPTLVSNTQLKGRIQDESSYGYIVVPLVKEVYLVGISKGASVCVRFVDRSSLSTFFLFTRRDSFSTFILVKHNFIIVCFLWRYLFLAFFFFVHCVVDCSLRRRPFHVGGNVICWSLGLFVFIVLAWCDLTLQSPTVWPLIFSFSKRLGSTKMNPNTQQCGCYWCCCRGCCCWRQPTGSHFDVLRRTAAIVETNPVKLTLSVCPTGLFIPGLFVPRQYSKILFRSQ